MSRYTIELAGEGPRLDDAHRLLDRFVQELTDHGHTVHRAVCQGHTFSPAPAEATAVVVQPVIYIAEPGANP